MPAWRWSANGRCARASRVNHGLFGSGADKATKGASLHRQGRTGLLLERVATTTLIRMS